MKTPPSEICEQARRLGLRLAPKGDKLAVCPEFRIKPDFDAILRENTGELLAYLKARWLNVARQVLDGEWDSLCDAPRRECLTNGLKSVESPACYMALAHLAKQDHRQSCGGAK